MRQMSWPNSRGYHSANHLLLLRSGKPFFDRLLHQIQNASTCIYLQTYIFIADETGKPIIEALTMAAKRGVHVYLTIDAYGSAKLDEEATKNLAIAGVNIHRFQPIFDFRNLSIGRRLHHKIAVFDSIVAIVGGINISNNYNDVGNNTAWLDFAVEVQGEVAKTIEDRAKQIHFRRERTPLKAGKEKTALRREVIPVKMIINDWLRGYAEIIRSHRNSIRRAQKEIIISGSYFLPSRRFRKLLKAAAKRGVVVKIILTHVSDVPLSVYASRYFYRWLLKNDIQIFEWKHSVLHGKATVIDGDWTTIGSFNLNFLSAFESIELNLEISNPEFSATFKTVLEKIMKNDCTKIDSEDFEKKYTFIRKAQDWFAYQVIRYAMRFPLLFAKRLTNPLDSHGTRPHYPDGTRF